MDDGARSLEDALDSIGRMVEEGIGAIITTPHLNGGVTLHPNELSSFLARVDHHWSRLKDAAAARYPGVSLLRGHEIALDYPEVDLSDLRIRLGGSRFALVEWPRMQVPPGTVPVIESIVAQGYVPIIAHPERYGNLAAGGAGIDSWRAAGARIQVNHGSLVGQYGPRARDVAFRIIAGGAADYLSTDFHARPKLPLFVRETRKLFERSDALDVFRRLAAENPRRILRNENPEEVRPVELGRGVWDRLKGFMSGE